MSGSFEEEVGRLRRAGSNQRVRAHLGRTRPVHQIQCRTQDHDIDLRVEEKVEGQPTSIVRSQSAHPGGPDAHVRASLTMLLSVPNKKLAQHKRFLVRLSTPPDEDWEGESWERMGGYCMRSAPAGSLVGAAAWRVKSERDRRV